MESFDKLKNIFRQFPTVGPRTAGRFVYYLIKQPKSKIDELVLAIQELQIKIKLCQLCFQPYESVGSPTPNNLCGICSDSRRDKNLLCVVEKEADLISIEATRKFSGFYFILGGTIGTLRNENIENLRVEQLKKRVAENKFSEIIIALNPTPEGRATSVLVEREISALGGPASGWKLTHLARGIPVGGELEYADEETLQSAFEGRK